MFDLEIEYIETRGGASPEAIDALYDYLEEAGLFVLDFKTDGFIPCDGALRMIDLESVFPVEGSVAETLARHLLDPARDASAYFDHDTYAKQRASLKRAFCR